MNIRAFKVTMIFRGCEMEWRCRYKGEGKRKRNEKGNGKGRQEAQLMLTNPRDAFTGQSRSPNIVPFHMLGVLSSCAIVTMSLRSTFYRYSTSKNVVTLKSGSEVTQGHYKWYHSVDCVWFPNSVLYRNFVWDIRLQTCRDLENWVRSPSRLLEMSLCDRAHRNSYWRSIVTVDLSRVVSEIFNVEKYRDREIRVTGHYRSSKVVPFDRLCAVSY